MKKYRNIILMMIMMMVYSMTMVSSAFAAELPVVSVPVTVSLSGTLPSSAETFTVKIKADDIAYPMPERSENGIYTMTITGADTENIPAITYSKVGIYTYTIYQVKGTNGKCTYDDTVYTLTVYITNAEDGSGLETMAVLYPDEESSKQSGAEFNNVYETKLEPTAPSDAPTTGDESNLVLYIVLVCASSAIIFVLILNIKKKDKE